MNRQELKTKTIEFLKTFGYKANIRSSKKISSNLLLFTRPSGLGTSDEILVYFHVRGEESLLEKIFTQIEEKYSHIPKDKKGRRFFLSIEPLGIVPESVKKFGFYYQVPVWFFDREFSGSELNTPLKILEEKTKKYEKERIDQPSKVNGKIIKDLLSHFIGELYRSKRSTIRIVIAPAGYGKTVFMSSLYNKLRKTFIENKSRQKFGRRPIIMLPEHIKTSSSIEQLINNFIGDEYDYGMAATETFMFWLKNNYIIWLLDGLEELMLKIPDQFFYTLLDLITAPCSEDSQIVITVRKPLLVASPELKDFIDDWKVKEDKDEVGIKIYELTDWNDKQVGLYFEKNLNLSNKQDKINFIEKVKSSKKLKDICKVPYYCSLISELKENNEMSFFNDEVELTKYTFEKLCEREFKKGLDKDFWSIEEQKELFVSLALEKLEGNRISRDMLIEYAEIQMPIDIDRSIKNRQLNCIQRHGVLSVTGDEVIFNHDMTEELLKGIGIVMKKNEQSGINLEYLEKIELERDTLLFKYILKESLEFNWDNILNDISQSDLSPKSEANAFRNALQVYLSNPNLCSEDKLKDLLCSRNLSSLIFKDMDFKDFNFQNSNLTNVKFINCILKNVRFDKCKFRYTFIDSKCDLTNARIEGAVLESLMTENKTLNDKKEIERFFYERTKVDVPRKEPCQAAINLNKVLTKIIRKGKGYKIPEKFVLQTKCEGGISSEKIVDALIKIGYFKEEGGYLKIAIKKFNAAEKFINDWTLTDELKKALDSICRDLNLGCKHVYRLDK